MLTACVTCQQCTLVLICAGICLQAHRERIKYNLIHSNLNMYLYHYIAVCEWQTFHRLTAVVLFSAQPHKY